MLRSLLRRLWADGEAGLTEGELDRMGRRNPFARFLPYLAYDGETRTYLLQGDAVGALWECTPLAFASPQTVQGLDGLFRLGFPEGSSLQLLLHADPHIEPYLEEYQSLKTRDVPIRAPPKSARAKNGADSTRPLAPKSVFWHTAAHGHSSPRAPAAAIR